MFIFIYFKGKMRDKRGERETLHLLVHNSQGWTKPNSGIQDSTWIFPLVTGPRDLRVVICYFPRAFHESWKRS